MPIFKAARYKKKKKKQQRYTKFLMQSKLMQTLRCRSAAHKELSYHISEFLNQWSIYCREWTLTYIDIVVLFLFNNID